jgi:aryl-alcohol dehydrogenase-like predicted oxidoreductase
MWNAAMRDFERDLIPMCKAEGMGLCPYGALSQGWFQTVEGFKEREKNNPGRKLIKTSSRDKEVSAVLEKLSEKKGLPLLNIALAYILNKTPYVFPIIGGRKLEHLEGNIPVIRVFLSQEDVDTIESSYEFDHGFPTLS